MQEIDDPIPVTAMPNSQLPKLFLKMPRIWHAQVDSEFLEQVESPGNSSLRLGIERVYELFDRAPAAAGFVVLNVPHNPSITIML